MSPLSRAFCVGVVVADLVAVVYFGGQFLLTGTVMPDAQAESAKVAGLPEAGATPAAGAAAAAQVADAGPIVGNPEAGKKVAAKCKACHTFDKGGKNGIGPNQWGVFGASFAHTEGFNYSAAILAEKGKKVWDEANLDKWLENPRAFLPGNKMTFNGLKKPQERADLIAYLKTLQ